MHETVNSWSTGDVAPRRALAYWNELLSDKVLKLAVRSRGAAGFGGHMTGSMLGRGRVYLIAAHDDQDIRHGRDGVAGRADDALCLVHMRAGALHIEARGRDADLVPGDCVLLDSKERFDFRLPERSASLVLRFTAPWLRRWMPHYEDHTARRIAGDQGWGQTLSHALAQLDPRTLHELSLGGSDIADQVGGLLALACGHRGATTRHGHALRIRIETTIRERAAEAGVDPAAVAAEVGISKRYLHKLLATEGLTFGELLYGARLEIATRLLANPRLAHLGIAEIAASAGFADASHLGRRLRARHGMSPSAYRASR